LCFDPSIGCCRSVVYFNIDAPIKLGADVKIDKKTKPFEAQLASKKLILDEE